jgi:surface protein
MLRGATSFNQPLNSWNTSGVTNMANMFQNASSFNQPLDTWDVSKVTAMTSMFNGASAFNQDLSSRKISAIAGTNMTTFLTNSNLSTYNYNALLDAWVNFTGTKTGITFGASPAQYGGCPELVTNSQKGIEARIALTTATNKIPPTPLYERGL